MAQALAGSVARHVLLSPFNYQLPQLIDSVSGRKGLCEVTIRAYLADRLHLKQYVLPACAGPIERLLLSSQSCDLESFAMECPCHPEVAKAVGRALLTGDVSVTKLACVAMLPRQVGGQGPGMAIARPSVVYHDISPRDRAKLDEAAALLCEGVGECGPLQHFTWYPQGTKGVEQLAASLKKSANLETLETNTLGLQSADARAFIEHLAEGVRSNWSMRFMNKIDLSFNNKGAPDLSGLPDLADALQKHPRMLRATVVVPRRRTTKMMKQVGAAVLALSRGIGSGAFLGENGTRQAATLVSDRHVAMGTPIVAPQEIVLQMRGLSTKDAICIAQPADDGHPVPVPLVQEWLGALVSIRAEQDSLVKYARDVAAGHDPSEDGDKAVTAGTTPLAASIKGNAAATATTPSSSKAKRRKGKRGKRGRASGAAAAAAAVAAAGTSPAAVAASAKPLVSKRDAKFVSEAGRVGQLLYPAIGHQVYTAIRWQQVQSDGLSFRRAGRLVRFPTIVCLSTTTRMPYLSEKIFMMLVAGVAQYLARCLRRTKSGGLAGCRAGEDEDQALTMVAAELAEGMRLTRRRVMWDGRGGPVVTKWKKDPYSTSALFLSMSFDRMMREAFVAKGVFDRMRELARAMEGSSFS